MGDHLVHAGDGGVDAPVREARRPLRPQAHVPGRDLDLPRRVGRVRHRADDGAAPRRALRAGARRRRARRAGDGDDRRHRPRATARAMARLSGRHLRGCERGGSGGRRSLRRAPQLAVGVPDQRAGGRAVGVHRADRAAAPLPASAARARHRGLDPPDDGPRVRRPHRVARRARHRVDLCHDGLSRRAPRRARSPVRPARARARRNRCCRSACSRTPSCG